MGYNQFTNKKGDVIMSNKVVKCKNCGEEITAKATVVHHKFKAISTKLLVFFLVSVMCIACTSCGKPSEVQLTKENIKDYLSFDFSYEEGESTKVLGFYSRHADIITKTYPISSGSFSDVKITIEIPVATGWSIAGEPASNHTFIQSFRLPASGEYTNSQELISLGGGDYLRKSDIKYTITSVSGTFTPAK